MIKVECPSCAAPYELDERRLPPSGMNMRCPKCSATFPVRPPGAPAPKPAAPKPAAPAPPTGPRKRTMVGVGASVPPESFADLNLDSEPPPPPAKKPIAPAFPAPPPPAAAKPAAPKKPIAPAFPSPPKPAVPAPADLGFKVPPPKPAAPKGGPLDLTDLPAPARSTGPKPLDLADLPAPKGAATRGGVDALDLDLPAPKGAATRGGVDALDLADLPAPKGAATRGAVDALDLDLPAPKGGGAGFDVDLPAPKGAADRGDMDAFDVDLPAPKGGGAGFDADLPAPKGASAFDLDLDLDLPAPKAAGSPSRGSATAAPDTPFDAWEGEEEVDLPAARDELDLPMPKSGSLRDELDLPIPKIAGGFGDELDLPMPKPQGGFGDELDLPVTKGQSDLPRPAGPAPAAPRPAEPLAFDDELDFSDAMPDVEVGGELDFDDQAAPRGSADFGDLEIPSLPPPPAGGGDSLELDDVGFDDALALPEPVERGALLDDATADGRTGAGGTGFGELDLDEGEDEGLEFDDLPQEGAGEGAASALPAERPSDTSEAPAKRPTPPRKVAIKGLLALAAVLVVLVGAGASLTLTKYGAFGIYFLERFLPEAGDSAQVARTIEAAESKAASDTYVDVRESLRILARERRQAGLNRALLTRSLLHESLFQVRFGPDASSAGRAQAIRLRLQERSDDAPGIDLALAAEALSARDFSRATRHLGRALSTQPSDPYAHLVEGELALAQGQAADATAAFQKALDAGGVARAQWGLARATRAGADADAYRAAVEATVALSPGHVPALTALAALLWDDGERDAALQRGREAAGLEDVDGRRLRGSARARSTAFAFLGERYEQLGRRARASAMFEQAVELNPFDVRALLGAGRALLLQGHMRDALARFDAVTEALASADEPPPAPPEGERPYEVQAELGAVEALLGLERPQDARQKLAELEQRRPDDPVVYLWQGRVAEVLGETEAAIALLRKVIDLEPTSFDGYNALAHLYFEAERHDDAVAVLDEAAAHVEVTAEVRRLRGESELLRDHLDAAIAEFEAAVELDPNDTASRFGLGVAYRRSGQLAQASAAFEALAAIDPAYPGLSLERGKIYEAQGEAAHAVRAYEQALEQTPDDVDLMLRLGGAQVMAGDIDAAGRTLRQVIERRPDSAEAEYFMGRVAFARGELNEAQTHFARAVQLDASRPEFHLYLGWVYFERNDIGRAQTEIREALERDPTLTEGYLLRAQLGVRTGAVRDALRDVDRVLSLNPHRYDAYAVQGEANAQLGKRGDAVRSYQRAVEGDPTNGKWWYRYGRMLYDHGDRRQAAAALDRSTELGAAEEPMPSWLPEAHRLAGEVHQVGHENAKAIRDYRAYLELAGSRATDRPSVERALARMGARVEER